MRCVNWVHKRRERRRLENVDHIKITRRVSPDGRDVVPMKMWQNYVALATAAYIKFNAHPKMMNAR